VRRIPAPRDRAADAVRRQLGLLIGLVIGVVFGALFTHTLRGQGLTTISIPWGQDILFLVVAAVVGVLAALWPAVRAARTRPLEAISAE